KSFDVVVIVILGGMGSTVGVIAAAIILTVLNEYLRDYEQYRMIIFSLLLIIMMLLRPQGLLPATLFEKKGRTA
ncbi:MAG: branched-chain amino acid ABC transporter permease, partial [Verrucomicrobiaceae bacterium]